MPAELLEELASLAREGPLPPWSEWFGPGVMPQQIPDEAKRRLVTSELPRLPIQYFKESFLKESSLSSSAKHHFAVPAPLST
jgi:hypothetical protein